MARMRTTDPTARAIQRGNMIAMGLYAAAAVMLARRFQSWPPGVGLPVAGTSNDSFVGRVMLEHPAVVWLAIPLTLLVANSLAIAVGDRGNLFRLSARVSTTPPVVRAARARALAWLGCAMTTFTMFVSGLFYAGWHAVERRDAQVFWRGITMETAVLVPVVALFVGLTAWNAFRGLERAPVLHVDDAPADGS